MKTLAKKILAICFAFTLTLALSAPAFATAYPDYNKRVAIYNVGNSTPRLNAACSTAPVNHTNVTMWSDTGSDTQRWYITPIDLTRSLFYVRNFSSTPYALNIYPPSNNNCDLYPITSNDADDCTIKFVDEGSNRFGMVLPSYALCLTPTGFSNGSNVNWQGSNGQLNQLWKVKVSTK